MKYYAALVEAISDGEFYKADKVFKKIIEDDDSIDYVEGLLKFIEISNLDPHYGIPGSVDGYCERYFKYGYEELLFDSLTRKPTVCTLRMLNNILRSPELVNRDKYLALLKRIASDTSIDDSIRLEAYDSYDIHALHNIKILSVNIETQWYIFHLETDEYPYVTISASTCSMEPVQSMLDDGWKPGGFLYYEGKFHYSKKVDIRTILKSIRFSFIKRTDDRDYATFGFLEKTMYGNLGYDVPEEMLEEVARAVFDLTSKSRDYYSRDLPEPVRSKLIKWAQDRILEDEYEELGKFAAIFKKELIEAIDLNLDEKAQKDAFTEAYNVAKRSCPALFATSSNRVHHVMDRYFTMAYGAAGITRQNK